MACPNCGSIHETGTYCTKCGAKLEKTKDVNDQSSTNIDDRLQEGKSYNNNSDIIKKGIVVTKQYFSHFIKMLKKPMDYGKDISSESFINGMITIFLFSFIFSLTIYIGVNNFFDNVSGSLFEEDFVDNLYSTVAFYKENPSGEIFVKALIYLLLILAVIVFTIFGILKINKENVSFKHVIARFGAFLIIPTVFILISFLLTLLNIGNNLMNIFSVLTFISLFLSIGFTVYSYRRKEHSLDPFYGTMIVITVMIVLTMIVGENIGATTYLPFGY